MWTSLVAQMVRNLHTMQETWVQSLGQEDPLEKEMATHFSTLAWRIPWTEEPGRLYIVQRVSKSWIQQLLTQHQSLEVCKSDFFQICCILQVRTKVKMVSLFFKLLSLVNSVPFLKKHHSSKISSWI